LEKRGKKKKGKGGFPAPEAEEGEKRDPTHTSFHQRDYKGNRKEKKGEGEGGKVGVPLI